MKNKEIAKKETIIVKPVIKISQKPPSVDISMEKEVIEEDNQKEQKKVKFISFIYKI